MPGGINVSGQENSNIFPTTAHLGQGGLSKSGEDKCSDFVNEDLCTVATRAILSHPRSSTQMVRPVQQLSKGSGCSGWRVRTVQRNAVSSCTVSSER